MRSNFAFRRFYNDAAGARVSIAAAEFLLFDEQARICMISYTQPVGAPEPGGARGER